MPKSRDLESPVAARRSSGEALRSWGWLGERAMQSSQQLHVCKAECNVSCYTDFTLIGALVGKGCTPDDTAFLCGIRRAGNAH